ncbi:MAG: hypothetical protein HYX87_08980, partial [Chloroflexi bacterium]|nr:hypothetical protein [Chloroflexota bacterium]
MATRKTRTTKMAKKEAVHGQERIQQLMEEFPEIDRTLIVKADVLREGIKPNADSRMIGRWSLPNTKWYFSYDKEDIYGPDDATEGYVYSPGISQLSNGLNLLPMFDSRSPWEFRYEGRGRYRLYRDGDPIEEVFFPPRPQWYDRKTSRGKPMPSIIAQRLDNSLFLVPLNYCEYAKDNLLCKYCNINASEAVKKGLGMERLVGKRDQVIYENYVAAAQVIKQFNLGMSGGVLLDSSKEADNYARISRVLK